MAILPVGMSGEAGGYQITRSLRFNSADSAYLSRTPASAGNQRKFTFSTWAKLNYIPANSGEWYTIISAGDYPSTTPSFKIDVTGNIRVAFFTNSSTTGYYFTSMNFRDFSSWYHIILAVDTEQAVAEDRVKMYVNGNQISFGSVSSIPQNYDTGVNTTQTHRIGAFVTSSGLSSYGRQYLADVHFIDGQALTPSSFGETDDDTGVWKPKAYTGSYGTNGFRLDFSDNSSTTALGYDAAGSNDWTPNNFSVTAGAGNDSLVDTPTPYGTDTGAGGEVRGNYCTLNPLKNNTSNTLSNGNLDVTAVTGDYRTTNATIGVSSGKWYWEVLCNTVSGTTNRALLGIATDQANINAALGNDVYGWGYYNDTGQKRNNNSFSSYGASYSSGDLIGFALDMDAGTLTVYKNNVSQGTMVSGLTGTWFPSVSILSDSGTTSITTNFGQRPFAYTAPSGFKALCTQNLPEPTVVQGDDYFNTVLYTGDGTSNRTITTGLQSDFVWIKRRNDSFGHLLFDVIRGAGKTLRSQSEDAESNDGSYYVQQFNSDNFLMGNSDNANNASGGAYVSWVWKANGAGVTNTAGTITSTVSANTTSGFSIVTYTGTGSNATVGHGLGVAPSMVIVKSRDAARSWNVWHSAFDGSGYMLMEKTNALASEATKWNNTIPTSVVFSLGTQAGTNTNTEKFVAYCFAPVAGFSAFGSYVGTGNSDGPMIYLGFRPAFIMRKNTSAGTSGDNWYMQDVRRVPYNVTATVLAANQSYDEATFGTTNYGIDILSNGFKVRDSNAYVNNNGSTYIYAAFAENPFKYALAR